VMYYFRVLVLRCVKPENGTEWSIDLVNAPSSQSCILTLLCIGLGLAIIAAIFFAKKEFRMKTPESN
jgi:hypothetical protein